MGNFDQKVNKFIEIFVEQNGYAKVIQGLQNTRSEERRVGKECPELCRSRWSPYH